MGSPGRIAARIGRVTSAFASATREAFAPKAVVVPGKSAARATTSTRAVQVWTAAKTTFASTDTLPYLGNVEPGRVVSDRARLRSGSRLDDAVDDRVTHAEFVDGAAEGSRDRQQVVAVGAIDFQLLPRREWCVGAAD